MCRRELLRDEAAAEARTRKAAEKEAAWERRQTARRQAVRGFGAGSLSPEMASRVHTEGLGLRLTAEERLERQTTQIGKIVREAIAANRSLGGKAMQSIEQVFTAIDKDVSHNDTTTAAALPAASLETPFARRSPKSDGLLAVGCGRRALGTSTTKSLSSR